MLRPASVQRFSAACLRSAPRRCAVTCSSLPRVYCVPLPAARHALSAEESRHLTRVLRLGVGDGVELFDGDGACVAARIAAIDARGGAEVEPCAVPHHVPWSGPRWEVAVACTGLSTRADWLVEKAAELGAYSLTPLLTERAAASKQRRAEQSAEWARWGRLSVAASKQCLRLHSLRLAQPTPLREFLPAVRASALTLVALQGGEPLREVLAAHREVATAGGTLVIGPPGDFTAVEKEWLLGAGGRPVSLGQLRLRTETAAAALLAACTFG